MDVHDRVNVIRLAAVNVGFPTILGEIRGEGSGAGIRKRPVPPTTLLWVSALNLAGDAQADLSVHRGPDKAVYAYPSEHLEPWAEELGEELRSGPLGVAVRTDIRAVR